MAPKTNGLYVRPLLGVNRREIEDYLRERGIAWQIDSSNLAPDFLRNRIRHELIPLLATYNPAISERLAATAEALAADEEFLETATSAAFAGHASQCAERIILSAPGARSEPRAIRFRLYRRVIAHLKGDLALIGFRHLQALDRLLFSPKPHQSLKLPDDLRVTKSYKEISFSTMEETRNVLSGEICLDGPGTYLLPGGGSLVVDLVSPPDDPKSASALTTYYDAELAPFPWRVRTFRPGDRFSPSGMTGRKKVKALFIDEKIPLEARRRIPLLFCGETLLWVGGIRRSGAASLTTRTKSAVRVELRD